MVRVDSVSYKVPCRQLDHGLDLLCLIGCNAVGSGVLGPGMRFVRWEHLLTVPVSTLYVTKPYALGRVGCFCVSGLAIIPIIGVDFQVPVLYLHPSSPSGRLLNPLVLNLTDRWR